MCGVAVLPYPRQIRQAVFKALPISHFAGEKLRNGNGSEQERAGQNLRSWSWRRSDSPATEPSGPVTKLGHWPLDHLQLVLAPPWTQEANGRWPKCPPSGPPDLLAAPRRCIGVPAVSLRKQMATVRTFFIRTLPRAPAVANATTWRPGTIWRPVPRGQFD
jgi:hypothetical protein